MIELYTDATFWLGSPKELGGLRHQTVNLAERPEL